MLLFFVLISQSQQMVTLRSHQWARNQSSVMPGIQREPCWPPALASLGWVLAHPLYKKNCLAELILLCVRFALWDTETTLSMSPHPFLYQTKERTEDSLFSLLLPLVLCYFNFETLFYMMYLLVSRKDLGNFLGMWLRYIKISSESQWKRPPLQESEHG